MLTETLGSTHGKLGPRTRSLREVRVLEGLLRRLAQRNRLLVLRAPRNDFGPPYPQGCGLARVVGTSSAANQELAKDAMRAAGEPNGLVATRLALGDEFFGWRMEGRIVSFGWVTYRDRMLGPIRLVKASGRAFLYNFHTLEGYRGQRLYQVLLLTMRHVLGLEKVTEFVIDVDVRNTASVRGIEKGGFVLAARVAFLTFFARWRCLGSQTVLDRTASSLFRPND